jgi:hypothetical protein
VNPDSKSMELFTSANNTFESAGIFNIHDGATEVNSIMFPDLKINLLEIFKD